jgi:two-component system, response regulator PdtaR
MATPEGLHALIVEDELLTGLGLQSMLQPLGFASFAFASTQFQALEQARLRRPDLVTLDLTLLDGYGLDAAKAIRNEIGPVPMMFVTGDPSRAERLDATAVLAKPVTPGMLANAVARLQGAAPEGSRLDS